MINIQKEVSLSSRNTFGIPATASVFFETDNDTELVDVIRSLPDPFTAYVLGGGSNILLVSDRLDVVIHPVMKGIELINETDDHVIVRVGAGEIWDDFVKWSVEHDFAGVEKLSYIPGTVGACPIQNIGAYGCEAKETIESVEAIEKKTGCAVSFSNQQCQFDYRDSFFKKKKGKYVITAVRFRLSKHFEPNINYSDLQTELSQATSVTLKNVRQAVINIRRLKLPDPSELGNAGSFFKNPTIQIEKSNEMMKLYPKAPLYPVSQGYCKISAAWLIQQCGWKGIREGNVGTYERQPLVIVNYGGANGAEILNFAQKIIETVYLKFDIRLETEVNIV